MAKCALTDCPGVVLNQPHVIGDNECGYLNAAPNPPKPKMANDPYVCRRPNCAATFFTEAARLKHETDASKHRKADMTFICDWSGHAAAIQDHDLCPVCQ